MNDKQIKEMKERERICSLRIFIWDFSRKRRVIRETLTKNLSFSEIFQAV